MRESGKSSAGLKNSNSHSNDGSNGGLNSRSSSRSSKGHKNNIPAELKDAIVKGQLIVFAGAGLSYTLKNQHGDEIGGWNTLVQKILEHLSDCEHDVPHLLALMNKVEPIKILDHIESQTPRLPKRQVVDFTKSFFQLADGNDFGLHKKLAALSNKIITTNYDTAFEMAVPNLRLSRAFQGTHYELTKHKDPHAKLLYKLHGCYEMADSMVLFPTQYKALYESAERNAQHALMAMKNIIMNNTVLFIGTGMGDYQINSLFKEIQHLHGDYNQPHFIITNETVDSSLSFLTPLSIQHFDEIETIIDDLLAVAQDNKSASQTELENQLEQAKVEIAQLTTQIEQVKGKHKKADKNKEKIALKVFSRGLTYSLDGESQKAIDEYEAAACIKPELHEAWTNWGTDLGKLAGTQSGEQAEALYRESFEKYARAVEINPDKYDAWYNWGVVLGKFAGTQSGEQAEALHHESFEKYARAVQINPDKYEAWHNWGTDLGNLAGTQSGEQAEALHHESFEKYARAVQINAELHEAWHNWGTDLGNLAGSQSGEQAEALYRESFEKYARAVEINPDKHEAWHNWGVYLGKFAVTQSGEQAEALYRESFEKYARAVEINPDKHDAWHNWGTDLGNLAGSQSGEQAEALYRESFEKYARAVQIKADKHEAWHNWGTDLGNLAGTQSGEQAEALYRESFEKYARAVEINADKQEAWNNWGGDLLRLAASQPPGSDSTEALIVEAIEKSRRAYELSGRCYNLACAYAWQCNKSDALKYLDTSLSNEEITPSFVWDDDDWSALRDDAEFKALLAKH